jgi:hypothetical protein
VAVKDDKAQGPGIVLQGLVASQAMIEEGEQIAQLLGGDLTHAPADGVGAGFARADQRLQAAGHFQFPPEGIERAQAPERHQECAQPDGGRGDLGLGAGVVKPRDGLAKGEDFFQPADKAGHHERPSFRSFCRSRRSKAAWESWSSAAWARSPSLTHWRTWSSKVLGM